jgi:hypothetical protein
LSSTRQILLIDRYLAFADDGSSLAPKEGPNDGIDAMHDVIGFGGGIRKEKVDYDARWFAVMSSSGTPCDDGSKSCFLPDSI